MTPSTPFALISDPDVDKTILCGWLHGEVLCTYNEHPIKESSDNSLSENGDFPPLPTKICTG